MKKNKFYAAMYLRLSKQDNATFNGMDKSCSIKSESNSIKNQRDLIRIFISRQPDIDLYDIYVDDGFSGSNFARVR